MKRLLLTILIFLSFQTFAQSQTSSIYEQLQELKNSPNKVSQYQLFDKSQRALSSPSIKDGQPVVSLLLDVKKLQQLISEPETLLSLSVPTLSDTLLELDLFPVSIFTPDFKVKVLSDQGETEIPISNGSFYRGIIKGDPASLVSISIFNDEISGFIANKSGTRTLGKYKGSNSSKNEYLLYYDSDLVSKPDFSCEAIEPEGVKTQPENITEAAVSCNRGVGIYFEVDKHMFDRFGGSATNVQNYVLALFNQIATLYSNESILIRISGLGIWSTNDPYRAATNTSEALDAFRAHWNAKSNTYPGQLAHLLSTRDLGGGRAYLDVLCGIRYYAYGVSQIYGYFNEVPTYSWDVNVIAHELGHNFGSEHTQWCGWTRLDGTTGALDNCYTTEGGCPPGPAPNNGGTIMSYCHLTSYINPANGFGPVPGNFIRNRYNSASCLGSSNTSAPNSLIVSDIQSTKVSLNWTSSVAYPYYIVQYRPQNGPDVWTEKKNASSGFTLTNLTPNTAYFWRVKELCSDFSPVASFSTIVDPYCEPVSNCSEGDGVGSFTLNGQPLSSNNGCSNRGYTYFSNAPIAQLMVGSSYPFSAVLLSTSYQQHVKIWIDYNKDNFFGDDEVVYATSSTVLGGISGTMNIASDIPTVQTRMRVRVKYSTTIGSSCETYQYGETEDYPVQIVPMLPICESQSSGDWSSSTTWSCGRVPQVTDDVIIKEGHTITLSSTASAKSVEFKGSPSQLQYVASGQLQLGTN